MNEIFFYCFDCDRSGRPPLSAIPGYTIEYWRPRRWRPAPACGLSPFARVLWPAFHHFGVFRNRDHAIVHLQREQTCVHRTLVLPPFFRFPFMAPADLQCGNLWTAPEERGRGLAAAGLAAAVHQAWRPGRKIWYLTTADNLPSQRLALSAGFAPAGQGQRTSPWGLKIFGQFVVTSPADAIR